MCVCVCVCGGWEGIQGGWLLGGYPAVLTGREGIQLYGLLVMKLMNIFRAGLGLSVGTMCPAPCNSRQLKCYQPATADRAKLLSHSNSIQS